MADAGCFVCRGPSYGELICRACRAWAAHKGPSGSPTLHFRVLNALARRAKFFGARYATLQQALDCPADYLVGTRNLGKKGIAWLRSEQDWPPVHNSPPTVSEEIATAIAEAVVSVEEAEKWREVAALKAREVERLEEENVRLRDLRERVRDIAVRGTAMIEELRQVTAETLALKDAEIAELRRRLDQAGDT